MADLLSALGGGATKQPTQLDQLEQSYRATQQSRLDTISSQQKKLENQQKFFNTLNSKMNTIVTALDTMSLGSVNDKFKAKKISSSDSTVATATSDGTSTNGFNSVKVNRLASNDRLISKRLTSTASFGGFSGTKSFEIAIGGENKLYNVTLDGTETNEQAMKKIINAVNADTESKVNLSVVKDTSSTIRLTLSSKETGSAGEITIKDSDIFSQVGLDPKKLVKNNGDRKLLDGEDGGYKVSTKHNLDSEAEVNGITITRSSNTLEEVVPGLKISLLKAQESSDSAISLTTDTDTDSVIATIKPLMDAFNDLLAFASSDSTMKRGDSSISNLISSLRTIPSSKVKTASEGSPEYLTNIGLKVDSKGALTVGDTEVLEKYLTDDPKKVYDLFTSADGMVAKVKNAISSLKGDGGIIKSRSASLITQIQNTKDRYTTTSAQIDKLALATRRQYSATLKTYLEAQNQYGSLSQVSG